jgi:hypothetical protein
VNPPLDPAVRYLLGDLSDAERDALEERYFTDEEAFLELKAAEDDLIDAYSRGTLAAAHRPAFEARYLESDTGRARVEFARALAQIRPPVSAPAPPRLQPEAGGPRWGAWAAGLAAVAVGGALLGQLAHLQTEVRDARAERAAAQQMASARETEIADQRRRMADLAGEIERMRGETGGGRATRLATLVLAAGLERGSGTVPRLRLDPQTSDVRITMPLPEPRQAGYDASLQTVDGGEPWRVRGLPPVKTPSGHVLEVTIPAAILRPGAYVLLVKGTTEPATALGHSYVFEVPRER